MRSHPGVCRGLAKSGLWPPIQTSKRSQKTQPKLWKQPRNDGRVRSEYLISFPRKSHSRSLGCISFPVSTFQTYLAACAPTADNLCVAPDTGGAGQECHLCSCRANDEGQYSSSHCCKQDEAGTDCSNSSRVPSVSQKGSLAWHASVEWLFFPWSRVNLLTRMCGLLCRKDGHFLMCAHSLSIRR